MREVESTVTTRQMRKIGLGFTSVQMLLECPSYSKYEIYLSSFIIAVDFVWKKHVI